MKKVRFAVLAAACLVVATTATASTAIDIRDCPVDTVVFVDPWAGAEFAVRRVGTDYSWQCPDGVEPPDINCMGPYGNLVLEGMYREDENSEAELRSAVWSVIKGVPCCGWSVQPGEVRTAGRESFKWLAPAEAPKLNEMSWLSIESDQGLAFGNPVYAASCTTR